MARDLLNQEILDAFAFDDIDFYIYQLGIRKLYEWHKFRITPNLLRFLFCGHFAIIT